MKKIIFALFFVMGGLMVQAQGQRGFVDFINSEHAWVDSVFNKLSPKERIAQMFMVRAHSNLGQRYIDSVAGVIQREQLGGIVLFQGGPVRHAQVINQYQNLSRVPMLVAFDGEWGLGMRLPDSTVSYPYQMTLGAIQDENLIYRMGREVARDFKRLGMHVNFAPVVDVNNNPNNPVIGFRSFGEDKHNVARKGLAYMRGMMDGGLIVSLKHFPGHGDTDVDSHHDLPVLSFSPERLDTMEMYPFKTLIDAGAAGVMVAHMHIPSLDNTPNIPSSISKPIVTGILRERLGFRGLTFTDAMDMKGVVKFFKDGEADVQAVIAGNDLLELSENSERAIGLVQKAIEDGRLDQADIDHRVKKILSSKYWLGLSGKENALVRTSNLYMDLNRWNSVHLTQQLADAAVTLLGGDELLRKLDVRKRTAIISIGDPDEITMFQEQLGRELYQHLSFVVSGNASQADIAAVTEELKNYDQVILALHDNRARPRTSLNYNADVLQFVSQLAEQNALISVFANPYAMAGLPGLERAKTLLVCYQNEDFMQKAAVRVITGLIKASGKLPVTINEAFKGGDGL